MDTEHDVARGKSVLSPGMGRAGRTGIANEPRGVDAMNDPWL